MILNTTNPHRFICRTEELLIELLGGVRIDTLDRMRVTMKVTVVNRKNAGYLSNPELAGLSVRHSSATGLLLTLSKPGLAQQTRHVMERDVFFYLLFS